MKSPKINILLFTKVQSTTIGKVTWPQFYQKIKNLAKFDQLNYFRISDFFSA